MNGKHIKWEGPFRYGAGKDCVFNQESANVPGVYLWTLKYGDRHLVNYVGISSKTLSGRLQEHLAHYYCGDYTIYEPIQFSQGIKSVIYMPTGSILDFAPRFLGLAPSIDAQIRLYSLFVAKIEGDRQWLERVESGIINKLRDAGGKTESFLDNYRISRGYPEDDKEIISMSCSSEIEGMDSDIRI